MEDCSAYRSEAKYYRMPVAVLRAILTKKARMLPAYSRSAGGLGAQPVASSGCSDV